MVTHNFACVTCLVHNFHQIVQGLSDSKMVKSTTCARCLSTHPGCATAQGSGGLKEGAAHNHASLSLVAQMVKNPPSMQETRV